ncbi:phenylalanine--tRNA ligase subunit beta [Gammaproteobacteria bacterium]|nr:phenylalanine--tRNA ligase subunit beta [Gammaproteobacteria bacterium]
MLIDFNWFLSCFEKPIKDMPVVVAKKLSQAGIESEFHRYLARLLPEDLIVAKVVKVTKHPDADRLNCCEVSIGDKTLPIVCGCPSVKKDLLVVLAKPGYVLPDGTVIKRSKIRGVVSEGMLCSPSEIGFDSIYPSNGILKLAGNIQVGIPLCQYLDSHLQGYLEVDVTPNRGDAMSVMGIARVYSSMAQVPLKKMLVDESSLTLQMSGQKSSGSHYIHAQLLLNSHFLLSNNDQLKLSVAKFDSVNPMVDFLNLMMLELGQPFHAMDAEKISGQLHFRFAKPEEVFDALNGKTYTLTENDWVLADQQSICALAGIMGSQRTAITECTKEVLIEAAYFSTTRIAKTSRRLGLMTDSSMRFERGIDPNATKSAFATMLHILKEKTDIQVTTTQSNFKNTLIKTIQLKQTDIQRVYGQLLDTDMVDIYFKRLGFEVQPQSDGWQLTPPSYRQDIQSKTEAIESLAIFSSMFEEVSGQRNDSYDVSNEPYWCDRQEQVKDYLVDHGFCEIINCSIISKKEHERFGSLSPIMLDSPMGSLEVMRSTLLPGLLHTAQKDICHQNSDSIRMFEFGSCFQGNKDRAQEDGHFGILCGGRKLPMQSIKDDSVFGFFDLKGMLQEVLSKYFNMSVQFIANDLDAFFHPYQSASIYYQEKKIGGIGAIHPKTLQDYDIPFDCYFAYSGNQILCMPPKTIYQSPSLYPKINRDISFWVDKKIPYQSLDSFFSGLKVNYLKQVQCIDRYEQESRVSYSFRLTFQSDQQTLKDSLVDQQMTKIKDALSAHQHVEHRS